jgi:hypothetical protein
MRPPRRTCRIVSITLTVLAAFNVASACWAGKIEAVEGKRYELTKQHGPWMIMVATFHTTADDGTSDVGVPPEKAADALVYELRSLNLPAYVCEVTPDSGLAITKDLQGRPDRRKNLRTATSWGVIAGNYPSLDDELAQKSLAYVKKLRPKSLGPDSGVMWYAPKGEGPLRNAFLTTNPLLSHEEVVARQHELGARKVDTLLVKLNSAENYSLLENKGAYTLQVAVFSGRQVVQGKNSQDLGFRTDRENPLDLAGQFAQELVLAMREQGHVEAYVWHDHYQSIVTVGSYSSPNDPKLREMAERFKEKERVIDAKAGIKHFGPVVFTVNHCDQNGQVSRMMLSCMPNPLPIEVPQIRPRSNSFASAMERGRRR